MLHMKKGNFKTKLISFSFATVLLLTTLSATAWEINPTPHLNVQNTLEYVFQFLEPTYKSTQLYDTTYSTVEITGCLNHGKQMGNPTLPVKIVQLLIPPKKTVTNVEVTGNPVDVTPDGIDIVQNIIFPYQQAVPFGQPAPTDIVINIAIYQSQNPYPQAPSDDYHVGYSHGYSILDIALNPVYLIPSQGKVYYYPEMTLTITLEENDYVNPYFRNNPNDAAWVGELVTNPDILESYTTDLPTFDYPGGLCNPAQDYDYVIITTTQNGLDYWDIGGSIAYNWESLMDKHLEKNNLRCTLVTKQAIDACTDYHSSDPLFNDGQAHIREFCKDAYQDWGISYVLIGADAEWIPARLMDTGYEKDIDSDIYWSNLDNNFNADHDTYWGESGDTGFDLYAELFIGRLTCDIPQDISNWMTKSFYYMNNQDIDYLDNAGFYGGNTGWNCQGDDFVDYCAIKTVTNWLGPIPNADGPYPTWAGLGYGFETWNNKHPGLEYNISNAWTAEPPNPGWKGGSESVAIAGFRTAISNDEITLISGIAHANPSMSLDVYSSEWESQYHNTKPFFIHDFGCHCGDMDDADDGVLHSMLFHSDTELAFGCVYNTCYGWGNFDTTNSSSSFQAKMFWDYLFDLENHSTSINNWQLGKAHTFSKDIMAPTIDWDASYGTWRAIIQGCLLFADPAQLVKSPRTNDPPAPPATPDGPSEGTVGIEYTFTSTTTDPDNDPLYYMFDWGDGTDSGWVGPFASGDIGSATHIWESGGTFEVKVVAKDVLDATTTWSDPTQIYIGAPLFQINKIRGGLKVGVEVSNEGEGAAVDVKWTVTLTGGIQNSMTFQKSGIIESLPIGDSMSIDPFGIIFGLGKIHVTVNAELPYHVPVTKSADGFILGIFIIIR